MISSCWQQPQAKETDHYVHSQVRVHVARYSLDKIFIPSARPDQHKSINKMV